MDPRQIGTLLVRSPDRPGLVAGLAQTLFEAGGNVLEADQHTDAEAGFFFQRVRFDFAKASCEWSELEGRLERFAAPLDMKWQLHRAHERKRMAIFVSKTDHCLYDLLLRHRAGELPCDIALIVSNHEKLRPIAAQFGIEYRVFPIDKENKLSQEEREVELLRDAGVDLVVLARYMQVLSGWMIEQFPSRIINIHHSFLPAFVGGRPYQQAGERGVKLVGATAHYATTDLDEGPIIEQDVTRVSHRDAVADLVRRGRDTERSVLARAVRWHLEDRVLVFGNRTVVFS